MNSSAADDVDAVNDRAGDKKEKEKILAPDDERNPGPVWLRLTYLYKDRAGLGLTLLVLCACLLAGSSSVQFFVVPPVEEEVQQKQRIVYIPLEHKELIVALCERNEVPVWIVGDLVRVESGWKRKAIGYNRDGSRDLGLMQLNERYLDEFAFRYRKGVPFDPFHAEDSLSVGIRHLSVLRRNTESWRGALIAYNCGLSRYKRGDAPESSERYADRILEGEK